MSEAAACMSVPSFQTLVTKQYNFVPAKIGGAHITDSLSINLQA